MSFLAVFRLYVCLGAAFVLGLPTTASAHRFFWNPNSATYEEAYPFDLEPTSMFVVGELASGETDIYRVDTPVGTESIFAVLAPQACPEFLPELWVVAQTLPETEDAPFSVPEGYKALRVNSQWQPYRDYMMTARLGPNVPISLDESGYYLAVYAGDNPGYYLQIRGGRDVIGGTSAGFDALARFVRCG